MAQIVLTNAKLLVNAVDLSAYVKSIKINFKADQQDNTTMSATTHSRLAGLLDWQLDVEFAQDWALSQVDATLFPLVGAAAFAIEVRPTSSARSTTNPGYTGNATLSSYTPIGNKVGEHAVAPATFMAAGALARQTS